MRPQLQTIYVSTLLAILICASGCKLSGGGTGTPGGGGGSGSGGGTPRGIGGNIDPVQSHDEHLPDRQLNDGHLHGGGSHDLQNPGIPNQSLHDHPGSKTHSHDDASRVETPPDQKATHADGHDHSGTEQKDDLKVKDGTVDPGSDHHSHGEATAQKDGDKKEGCSSCKTHGSKNATDEKPSDSSTGHSGEVAHNHGEHQAGGTEHNHDDKKGVSRQPTGETDLPVASDTTSKTGEVDQNEWARKTQYLTEIGDFARKIPGADAEFATKFKESARDLSLSELDAFVTLLKSVKAPARKCPVTGEDLGSMGPPLGVTVKGKTLLVCCEGCVSAVKDDPDKFLPKETKEATQDPQGDKQKTNAETRSTSEATAHRKAQTLCPVTGGELGSMGKPIDVSLNGETIQVCCRGCVKSAQKDPAKYLSKVHEETHAK